MVMKAREGFLLRIRALTRTLTYSNANPNLNPNPTNLWGNVGQKRLTSVCDLSDPFEGIIPYLW